MNSQMVGWFEIPVKNMDRAVKFYNQIFQIKINVQQFGDTTMGWFPFADDQNAKGSGGSLILNPGHYVPSEQGSLVYFTSQSGDINHELSRIENAGGTILRGKTQISEEHGFMGLFRDTEGNRVALHSRQ